MWHCICYAPFSAVFNMPYTIFGGFAKFSDNSLNDESQLIPNVDTVHIGTSHALTSDEADVLLWPSTPFGGFSQI